MPDETVQEQPEDTYDPTAITAADIIGAREVKAVFSNRAYLRVHGSLLRLNLAELVEGKPQYHTAVVMTPADAYSIGELLMRIAGAVLFPPEEEEDLVG